MNIYTAPDGTKYEEIEHEPVSGTEDGFRDKTCRRCSINDPEGCSIPEAPCIGHMRDDGKEVIFKLIVN